LVDPGASVEVIGGHVRIKIEMEMRCSKIPNRMILYREGNCDRPDRNGRPGRRTSNCDRRRKTRNQTRRSIGVLDFRSDVHWRKLWRRAACSHIHCDETQADRSRAVEDEYVGPAEVEGKQTAAADEK